MGETTVAASKAIRLNLGAGRFHVEGWLSIDSVLELEPDICEDVCTLPSFQPNSVDDLYGGHIFEHVLDPIGALLRWFEVLKPGGSLTIAMPDHAAKAVEPCG
jgi:predicted SAM-dependent methyltransferase